MTVFKYHIVSIKQWKTKSKKIHKLYSFKVQIKEMYI